MPSKKKPPITPPKPVIDWDSIIARQKAYWAQRELEDVGGLQIMVGQVWEDLDTRRGGRRITVTQMDGCYVIGASSTGPRPVRIHSDRLTGTSKYRLIESGLSERE